MSIFGRLVALGCLVGIMGCSSSETQGEANPDGGFLIQDGGTWTDGDGLNDSNSSRRDGDICAGQTYNATPVPVDMIIMMDISGTMTTDIAPGRAKWDAIKSALTDFIGQSDGLGVGIQFFPKRTATAPELCHNGEDCGAWGICLYGLCAGETTYHYCGSDGECGSAGPCTPYGRWSDRDAVPCRTPGAVGEWGTCVQHSQCENANCDVAVYERPEVPIGLLPGNASAIINAIEAQRPTGRTPTSAALQGAINYAKEHANQQRHKVIVVFATDGLPTECNTDIEAIKGIARQGRQDPPSTDTFVIGVFGSDEADARPNLNGIAEAGGSGSAFMVNTSDDVATKFSESLNQIRTAAVSCELEIPPTNEALDYHKVNVVLDTSDKQTTMYYVEDASHCNPTTGGWYYDTNPAKATPSTIILCEASCRAFRNTGAEPNKINLEIGCKDTIRPPT